MIPILVIGFGDLQRRIEIQNNQCKAHLARIQESKQSIDELYAKHQITTLVKLDTYQRTYLTLAHRVLKVNLL